MMRKYAILPIKYLDEFEFNNEKIITSQFHVKKTVFGDKFLIEYDSNQPIPEFLQKLYIDDSSNIQLIEEDAIHSIIHSREWYECHLPEFESPA
jgi:hypothetical protein